MPSTTALEDLVWDNMHPSPPMTVKHRLKANMFAAYIQPLQKAATSLTSVQRKWNNPASGGLSFPYPITAVNLANNLTLVDPAIIASLAILVTPASQSLTNTRSGER